MPRFDPRDNTYDVSDLRDPLPRKRVLVALFLVFAWWGDLIPWPWGTTLTYSRGFMVEPWQDLSVARADLEASALHPVALEHRGLFVSASCLGGGCATGMALAAKVPWWEIPAALDRCFMYNPLRFGWTPASQRNDCQPYYRLDTTPLRSP
jgi:hypothetical protein